MVCMSPALTDGRGAVLRGRISVSVHSDWLQSSSFGVHCIFQIALDFGFDLIRRAFAASRAPCLDHQMLAYSAPMPSSNGTRSKGKYSNLVRFAIWDQRRGRKRQRRMRPLHRDSRYLIARH